MTGIITTAIDDVLASGAEQAISLATRVGVERSENFTSFALPNQINTSIRTEGGAYYIFPSYSDLSVDVLVESSRMTIKYVRENQAGAGSVLRAVMRAKLFAFQDQVTPNNSFVFDQTVAKNQVNQLNDWITTVYTVPERLSLAVTPTLTDFLLNGIGSILLAPIHPAAGGSEMEMLPGSSLSPDTLAGINAYLSAATAKVDLWDLTRYSVRDSFECYGVKIWLNDSEILGILCYIDNQAQFVKPSHSSYHRAECIARASISLHIVARLHAIRTHVCSAQKMALITRQNDVELKARVPILFHLLRVLTFNTMHKNEDVMILLDQKGFFNRAFALTETAFARFVSDAIDMGRLVREDLLGDSTLGWYRTAYPYYQECSKLVEKVWAAELNSPLSPGDVDRQTQLDWFQKNIVTKDDLVNFMFHATCFHGMVGDSTMDDFGMNGFLIPKVRTKPVDPLLVTSHDLLLTQAITRSVVTRVPQIYDTNVVNDLLPVCDQLAGFWIEFKTGVQQSYPPSEIDPNDFFNPGDFEISIGY